MANYIDDAGSYNYDAEFTGTKATNYDYSTTDECVWFDGSTGKASTGYTLPDSEWLVIEVYDMTGVTASNTLGGSHLHGKKEFINSVDANVVTQMNTWRTAYDTAKGSDYTTYEIIATHYKGSDLADVYEADETVAFTTATTTDGAFTGHGSELVISDDLLADSVVTSVSTWVNYYNDTLGTPPSGVTVNNFPYSTSAVITARALVNENNTDDGMTVQNTIAAHDSLVTDGTGAQSGDDSHFFPDCVLADGWRWNLGARIINIYLPTGTYNVYFTCSAFDKSTGGSIFNYEGGSDTTVWCNPTAETVRATFDDIEPDKASFLSITGANDTHAFNFNVASGSATSFINAIRIDKVG